MSDLCPARSGRTDFNGFPSQDFRRVRLMDDEGLGRRSMLRPRWSPLGQIGLQKLGSDPQSRPRPVWTREPALDAEYRRTGRPASLEIAMRAGRVF